MLLLVVSSLAALALLIIDSCFLLWLLPFAYLVFFICMLHALLRVSCMVVLVASRSCVM